MNKLVVCCLAAMGLAFALQANTYTLKSSISGVDFDWSDGANYVEEPAGGPLAGDTIVIPNGVTALMSAAASKDAFLGKMNVQVDAGAVLKTYHDGRDAKSSRYQSYVKTLTGSGTVTISDSQPSDVYADLVISSSCVFDGQIEGRLHYRMLNGVKFTISQNQPNLAGSALYRDTSELWLGCVGAIGASSGGLNLSTDSTLGYIGAPGLRESLSKPSYEGKYFRMDSGAYGGLTFDLTMNDVTSQRYVVLKGSNTTESIFGFQSKSAGGPIYMRKEGTGSWQLKNTTEAKGFCQYDGVTDIQGGVLSYTDALSPIGSKSALGTATNLFRWGAANALPDSDRIPYAILLGGDATNPGFLRSASVIEGIHSNYDRLVGLTGCGGFLSSQSRHAYAGISAASAGEKTLILDGEVDVCDTVSNVTDGEGVVSVEKRGSGTWTLRPPCDITGKISVKAGQLNLGSGPVSENYTWYRLRMKTNAFQDPLFAEAAKGYYETLSGKALPDKTKLRISVAEFMFFDANGNRQCVYPMRHCKNGVDYFNGKLVTDNNTIAYQSTNRWALTCQPGQFTAENPTADWKSFSSSVRAFGALFEGGADQSDAAYEAGTFHYNDWFDLTLEHNLDITDESTWVGVILRPTNNTPTLVACDFCNQDGDATQWVGRNLTAFDVAGSTDGVNWETLLDVRLPALGHNSSKSGAGPTTRTITAANLAKCYQFSQTTPTSSEVPAFDLSATVSVEPGAKLFCSSAVKISKLAIGADGMGAVSGGAELTAKGTISIDALPEGMISKTFATGLKTVSGASNLANWTLLVDGRPGRYNHEYDAETGSLTVTRKPFVLLFK